MKKIIILLLLLTILVGCQQSNTDSATTGSSSTFYGGDSGLDISFVAGAPPEEVIDQGQPFGISVLVENMGDIDVAEGDYEISLTGIDPTLFSVSPASLVQKPQENLQGGQIDAVGTKIDGAKISFDFPSSGTFQHSQEISGQVQYNIKADICYKYTTKANSKVCILEDILGTKGRQDVLCDVNSVKDVDSSGAPVKVVSLTESAASSDKIAFTFKVTHTGSGSIHKLGSSCDDEFTNRNKVKVTIDTGISGGLTCSGLTEGQASGTKYSGTIQLLNGERDIRCTQTVANPADFESLVAITIDYDYRSSVTKSLIVKHIG